MQTGQNENVQWIVVAPVQITACVYQLLVFHCLFPLRSALSRTLARASQSKFTGQSSPKMTVRQACQDIL